MHLLDSEGFFNFSSKPTKLNISINTISIAIILIDAMKLNLMVSVYVHYLTCD